jgi:altronate dehydratase large subunit
MPAIPQAFWGYRRADGSAGIRNHLVVIPSVVCANTVAQRVAALLPGAVAVPHPHGCAQVGDDVTLTERVLAGTAANPNVGAALIIGLGCETCQAGDVAELARLLAPGRPLESFSIQDAGGSIKAIAQGVELGQRLMARIAAQQRVEVPLAELLVATHCGGLDATSGLASNPTVGVVSDLVVDAGGGVLLSETTDLVGAKHVLARRVRDPRVAQRLLETIGRVERSTNGARSAAAGEAPAAPTGVAACTTLEEQSLGCIDKAGTTAIQDVLAFAERPRGSGLFIMDAPVYETVCVSAMAAGGAQICLSTTGRGSPLGNAICPVVKVCGNPATNRQMADNVDFSTAGIVDGVATKEELGAHLFQLLVDVCNGQLTSAELIGHHEFAIHRIGPTV